MLINVAALSETNTADTSVARPPIIRNHCWKTEIF